MISSRCETTIDFERKPQKLTEVRRALKKQLEDFRLPNQKQPLFECWINEDGTSGVGGSIGGTIAKSRRGMPIL